MGAASGQLVANDWGAACEARRSCASINGGLPPVVAIDAFEIPEDAEGGSSCANAFLKHIHQTGTELVELRPLQLPSGRVGCNAGSKQAFIGIDVAGTCHEALVQ